MATANVVKDSTGRSMVEVRVGYVADVLTPHEAERLIKDLRTAIDSAARANRTPTRFGDH